ncbi:unnamed protein product [Adineta ricciae]|uniref:Ubiquitinyl hydrolase 1 n=2 Tax=Adineta ricciae TaxID=249248 RepID=A0A813PIY2_ADIRI|nr:unnamed protein product [Adineta ricciae]
MKRSAHTVNSSLVETTNNNSPKRSCTQRNKFCVASSRSDYSSLISTDSFTMEDNIDSLVSMGFIDRELNRRTLLKANDDISEAVAILTSNYYNDDISSSVDTTPSTFIGPRTKEQVEQEQQQTVAADQTSTDTNSTLSDDVTVDHFQSFTTNAFLNLETKVYGDKWSIPYKRDEALGQCLLSATKLALEGRADEDKDCIKFMEDLIPEAFRKLQCTHHVNNWAVEIQLGVFDMVELLVDLIAARLSYPPVPVKLLETLAILFDPESTFQRKHRSKPYDRSLYDKQLGDQILANPPSGFVIHSRNETYGWLCRLINRFVVKDGIINLKEQFESEKPLTALEYNALLVPFVNCMDYLFLDRYRQLFGEHVEQAIEYVQRLKEEDFKAKSTNAMFELLTTLRKICLVAWPDRINQLEQLHLNLLLKMIALSNFNAKMNSLKELAKLIENASFNNSSTSKISMQRSSLIDWIIDNSILSKALEGNIDQNQYVDKVRILLDFIAPKILKEEIETIWKMQHGHSLVAVDHLFSLIASAAAKFNLQQLNFLIEFIYNSWKTETVLIQEKLIQLLGAIGRECQKESAARVLEVLWDIAHGDRLSRPMLDHILQSHLRIFSEGRMLYDELKREYCLKCVGDLKRKQGWLVPAIKHLNDLLRHDSTTTFKRTDQDLTSLLVQKHDLIFALIQSLSTCQLDVWNKTQGNVTIDTLVDGRYTHEESVKSHLDLLSFLLKKGNLFLLLKRAEELWDTLITNEHVSSFDHELGLNWFITCVEDLNRDSQKVLFEERVAKLDPVHLTPKGYACFKLYFERCDSERRGFAYNLNSSSSIINATTEYYGINELWNIILCVDDEHLADDATRFLLELYYTKHSNRTRRATAQLLHEYFLKEVYLRLGYLLNTAIPPSTNSTDDVAKLYASLKVFGEQFASTSSSTHHIIDSEQTDNALWLQKVERLLMITEAYIHLVEHEHSPTAHITSFHGLEYPIKVTLDEFGKTNCSYDLVTIHSNDTLEMLRVRLAEFYKVLSQDIHISIQNTRPLPQSYDHFGMNSNAIALPHSSSSSQLTSSTTKNNNNNNTTSTTSNSTNNNVLDSRYNSKYLYQLYITPETIVYVKILGGASNQPVRSITTEPKRIRISDSTFASTIRERNNYYINDDLTRLVPSNIMAENLKVYDVLYKLSFLDNQNIHQRIRNLLYLMPSDNRIHDYLDIISTNVVHPSHNGDEQSDEAHPTLDPRQAITRILDMDHYSFIQLLYNLEILSSRISTVSINNGVQQSSPSFRQHFIEQAGIDSLLYLLQSMGDYISDEYEYSLCEEIILLTLQLIQLLVCGNGNQSDDVLSTSFPMQMSPSASSPVQISQAASDAIPEAMEFDFQGTVEHLSFEQFVLQIQQLIFLCWAAAAGNIRLHGQSLTIKEQVKLDRYTLLQRINANVTNRTSSKNSSSSEASPDSSQQQTVQFGICVKNNSVLPLDSEIAEKSIEIITYCFEKRPEFFATFLVQPFFADFLLEILIGTTSYSIRQCALQNIIRLCKIETSTYETRSIIHKILIKARLPLWLSSSRGTRHANQKLSAHSIEYFDLRCQLSENLSKEHQEILGIDAKQLLMNELEWLSTYTVSLTSSELRTIDNILFIGHLKFIRTLLTCENVDKNEIGTELIRLLIDQFLFPASKRMSLSIVPATNENESNDDNACEPKCSTSESRQAAYDVLVELVRHCQANFQLVIGELINLHHRPLLEKQTEWDFMPQVNPRAACGLVGLQNGGATCYMNSILQQLYMIPQISEHILSVHDDGESGKTESDSGLFCQLQQVFGHLMESKMQYYSPEALWKVFRLWGQEINVREQQDAFDFFTAMTDQIDEYLKGIKQEEIFHKQFEGIFCNQMICTNGCNHRYEGEEKFMALNVAVKVDSLNESLNQFVKGEVLDGNNAYFCDKCQEKRRTIKRLCVKKLPPLLCIQMKRFGFDWENNRALKFDDYFKFPLVLNMEPYTLDGVNKRESFVDHDDSTNQLINSSAPSSTSGSDHISLSRTSSSLNNPSTINYELIGIVIHSGQANAGHYYSFIKDTRNRYSNNPNQWYRFNDTCVEEIQLTEQMLEEECFGGTFRVQKDSYCYSSEERIRFWNAYILIYQCIEPAKLLPPPSILTRLPSRNRRTSCASQRDSLSQLADLVVQSEHNDLFQTKTALIPSRVLACVKEENLEFLKNRDTYCEDYFRFIYNLCATCFDDINSTQTFELSTKLALNFLFNTHFRTHRRLRKDTLQEWIQLLARLFTKSSASCEIFYELIFEKKEDGLKLYLLDCPTYEVRQVFEQICDHALQASYLHNDHQKNMELFVEQLIQLLDKSVVEQIKQSQVYFQLIYSYMNMNRLSIEYLLKLNTFTRLMKFLLGESMDNRRWSSGQAKEFGIIHEIIATLALMCYRTENNRAEEYANLVTEMDVYFMGQWSKRYLKEICYAFQEISTAQLTRTSQLMEVLAKDNQPFSEQFIRTILTSINQAHTNDLKSLFKLLSDILLIEDSLQMIRLQLVFEGIDKSDDNDNSQTFTGLYSLIQTNIETEQRRAYQTVKFLVTLSNRNGVCREYFTSTVSRWEYAITWLKQQMQTSYQWSPAQNLSNEDNDTRSFQRTRSAQFTLEQAQSLLRKTTTASTGNIQHDILANESMEFSDPHSQSSSQSTLMGSD